MSVTVSSVPLHMQGVTSDDSLSKLMLQAAKFEESKRQRSNPVRLSNSGRCGRQIAYGWHNWKAQHADKPLPFEAEPLEPRVLVNFTLGDLVELTVTDWILKQSDDRFMPLPDTRYNVVHIELDSGQEISGHLDGLYQQTDELEVVDIKSINSRGFERIERDGPPADLVAQVNAYCAALSLKRWRLLFLRKETGHTAEWCGPFNPELLEITKARFAAVLRSTPTNLPEREYSATAETEWVRGVKQLGGDHITAGMLDPDGKTITELKKTGYWRQTGRQVLGFPCSYCAYKRSCWPTVEMEMAGDRPLWVIPDADDTTPHPVDVSILGGDPSL